MNASGLCNSEHCAHPCCWNYYRKVVRHQVSPRISEEPKMRTLDVPHQSIHNISVDLISNISGNANRPTEYKPNSLMEYLISRKKTSIPNVPPNSSGVYLRDATNISQINNKLSVLDVHEVFDIEELQSDWRKTFQAKDYYVWMVGNKEIKNVKDDLRKNRSIKTPILQLAPVTDSRLNSSLHVSTKKDPSLIGGGADFFNQRTTMRMKSVPKYLSRVESSKDISSHRNSESKNVKENIRQKSLEATLNQMKMQIHKAETKQFMKYDFGNPSQLYLLDDNIDRNLRDICFSSQSRQPPTSPNDSETGSIKPFLNMKPSKVNQFLSKGLSIIQNVSSENSFNLKLEPQPKVLRPIKSEYLLKQNNHDVLSDDKYSVCDSMITNALSNRSTLNDEDIFPGSSLLKMLQTSYKLIQERSDNMTDKSKEYFDSPNIVPVQEVPLHKINVSYSRTTKSAPDKKLLNIETPNPPPPSPDMAQPIRCMSAVVNINPL